MAGNSYSGVKRSDRTRGGNETNPRLSERKTLAARRADAEKATRMAKVQASGRATRSERWASPPAERPTSKSPRDPKRFCAEVLDGLLGIRRK